MHNQDGQLWRQTLVHPHTGIQEVIKQLDATGLQICLVVDDDKQLLGTVTDGDIRRALLRGLDLRGPVAGIMFRTPMVVPPEMGRDMVIHLMRANKKHQLPVVDDTGQVVGLHLWDEVLAPPSRPNPIVIMAGGFGKRLRPYTENCPKPMLPIGGKPMLEHIIERARNEGFSNFVISLHYLGHMIQDYFRDGAQWDVTITYLHETTPLGTAGAIAYLPQPTEPMIVTNGDVLTDIRYGELLDFHLQQKAAATMAVRQHEWQHPFGVVRTNGIKIVKFEEKPIHRSHVNAGIYVLDPGVLAHLRLGELCDMPTLFERIAADGGPTIAFPMHELWMDIGRPEDLQRANQESNNSNLQE
jgi:dTDP-glucose pyrophosphorylase